MLEKLKLAESFISCAKPRQARRPFATLEVPAYFFQQHLDDFATIGDDKINFFLAADDGMEFEDQRGPGKVSLAQFEKT
jgi:hypothetical protein